MNDFPSRTLVLRDHTGAPFGTLRLAPREPESTKWDAIFDVVLDDSAADHRSEVRYLAKRHFVKVGEHRVKFDPSNGSLTVSQGDFKLVLLPSEEGDFRTVPPSPPIQADWE